jgi:hypothetical protein
MAGGAVHQPVVRASTATAAAKKQVAAFTAVQENIQEKELHLEASESYLAVRLSCDLGGGGSVLHPGGGVSSV